MTSSIGPTSASSGAGLFGGAGAQPAQSSLFKSDPTGGSGAPPTTGLFGGGPPANPAAPLAAPAMAAPAMAPGLFGGVAPTKPVAKPPTMMFPASEKSGGDLFGKPKEDTPKPNAPSSSSLFKTPGAPNDSKSSSNSPFAPPAKKANTGAPAMGAPASLPASLFGGPPKTEETKVEQPNK